MWKKSVLAMAALAAISASANAAVITYDLSVEFSGATPPAGAGPWARFTISDVAPGTVKVKFDNIGLVGTEFLSGTYLNLDPSLDATNLLFGSPVQVGTFALPSISRGTNAFKADGDGFFDMKFDFATANPQRFGVGESLEYTVTGIAGLVAANFDFLSVNGPVGNTGYPAAAHVQSIGANGDDSGWVTVPEPAALSLVGVAAMSMLRRRKH